MGKRGGKTDIGSYWCEWWESNPLSNQTLLSPLALRSRPLSSVAEISCGFGRNRPKPTRILGVLGLFDTGRASFSYPTEALVHIYIPQPRGDLAVESLCRESLTWLSWASLFFGLLSLSLCFYYSTLLRVCQEVFENFFHLPASITTMGLTFSNPRPRVLPLLTSLLYHILTDLSSVFLTFFRSFFRMLLP